MRVKITLTEEMVKDSLIDLKSRGVEDEIKAAFKELYGSTVAVSYDESVREMVIDASEETIALELFRFAMPGLPTGGQS
jgi:hypothetical protein